MVISGELSDSQGNPVDSGSISIQVASPEGGSIHIALVYTESDGRYHDEFLLVEGLSDGSFNVHITASKSGYEDAKTSTTFSIGEPTSEYDFAISISPSSQAFSPGENITFNLTISSIGGFSHIVTLEVYDLPSGVTATFDPPSITPPSSSILQIQTSSSTPSGTHTLTIVGTGGGQTHSVNPIISSAKSGCLIVTATYGSELSPEVLFLRSFRDNIVTSTYAGSNFMRVFNDFYYSFSPTVANSISENPFMRNIAKYSLYPLISSLHIAVEVYELLDFNSEIGIIASGLVVGFMIGTAYVLPVSCCIFFILIKLSPTKTRLKNKSLIFLKLFGMLWTSSIILLALGEFFISPHLTSFASSLMVLTTMSMPATLTFSILSRKV